MNRFKKSNEFRNVDFRWISPVIFSDNAFICFNLITKRRRLVVDGDLILNDGLIINNGLIIQFNQISVFN